MTTTTKHRERHETTPEELAAIPLDLTYMERDIVPECRLDSMHVHGLAVSMCPDGRERELADGKPVMVAFEIPGSQGFEVTMPLDQCEAIWLAGLALARAAKQRWGGETTTLGVTMQDLMLLNGIKLDRD